MPRAKRMRRYDGRRIGPLGVGGFGGSGGGGAPTVLLYDTFTDANGTNLTAHTMDVGPGWTVTDGSWDIQSNQANSTTAFSLAISDAGFADVAISVATTVRTGRGNYIVFRYVDTDNYWVVYAFGGASWLMIQRVAGANTTRASGSAPAAGASTLAVTCSGTVVTATIDGANSISYGSATAHQTATKFGIAADTATGARFDDFEVSRV